jgi:hypothetical protein
LTLAKTSFSFGLSLIATLTANPMEKTVTKFLQFQKIHISKIYVEKIISSHPDYPSLLSIADAFERLGIDYSAWKISKEQLSETAFPYLLPISNGEGDILFVKSKKDLNNNEEKLNNWEGIIVKTEGAKEINDKKNRELYQKEAINKILFILLMGTISLALLLPFLRSFSAIHFILFGLSIIGLLVGYLLIAKDLGVQYESVESFCNSGKNTSCDRILNSEDAKILGFLKFSDAVFIYFTFQSITLSFSAYSTDSAASLLLILLCMSALSIPVVLFSFYYQYFKVKVWCNAVLILQLPLLFLLATQTSSPEVHLTELIGSAFLLVILVAVILLIKAVLIRAREVDNAHSINNRVKNSISVFTHLLSQERKVDITPFQNEILIGKPDAVIKITMASNLYCNPCRDQHEKLAELISIYPQAINLTIRFLNTSQDSTNAITPNQYILQYWKNNILNKQDESKETERLIHKWFKLMDLNLFKIYYPLQGSIDESVQALEKIHSNWFRESQISHTPTLFINGLKMPKYYSTDDLAVLLPSLVDNLKKSTESKVSELQFSY